MKHPAANSADALTARLRAILNGELTGSEKMPPVRSLASQFGVAFRTVLNACESLCTEGLLVRIPGRKGFFLHDAVAASKPPNDNISHPYRSDQIYETLRNELLQRQIEPHYGDLSIKALCLRFRAGRTTVAHAVARLIAAGILEKQGKCYRRPPPKQGKTSPVYLFVNIRQRVAFHNSPQFLFATSAEREMKRLGWGTPKLVSAADPMRDLPELWDKGHFLWLRPPMLRMIRNKLGHWKRHVLILIDPAGELYGASLRQFRNVYCIQVNNIHAGEETGRLLVHRNHKHTAFFAQGSEQNLPAWAAQRLEGIRSVLSKNAPERKVLGFFAADYSEVNGSKFRQERELLQECYTVESKWAHRLRVMQPELPQAMVSSGFSSVHNLISLRKMILAMMPVFDAALDDSSLTAWVCSGDPIAVAAHVYLSMRRIPPERSPLICGFDNSPMSYILGFSSYDFCWDRMGTLAIQCIRNPSLFPGGAGHVYQLPGELMIR